MRAISAFDWASIQTSRRDFAARAVVSGQDARRDHLQDVGFEAADVRERLLGQHLRLARDVGVRHQARELVLQRVHLARGNALIDGGERPVVQRPHGGGEDAVFPITHLGGGGRPGHRELQAGVLVRRVERLEEGLRIDLAAVLARQRREGGLEGLRAAGALGLGGLELLAADVDEPVGVLRGEGTENGDVECHGYPSETGDEWEVRGWRTIILHEKDAKCYKNPRFGD